MSYYAPFYTPPTYYNPNYQNGYNGQNFANNSIPQTQAQADTTMIWVLNKNEADGYPVAPNCSVTLWDKNAPTIYVKSMSSNGVPSMRILDYTERTETPQKSPLSVSNYSPEEYVTKDEITQINGKINDLVARCETLEQMNEERNKSSVKKPVAKGSEE